MERYGQKPASSQCMEAKQVARVHIDRWSEQNPQQRTFTSPLITAIEIPQAVPHITVQQLFPVILQTNRGTGRLVLCKARNILEQQLLSELDVHTQCTVVPRECRALHNISSPQFQNS